MGKQRGTKKTSHPARGMMVGERTILDDLAVFVAVAREASFVGGSRRLGIPTSSVSRAVARLEERLGVALLRRTSRTVAITDEGRELLQRAGDHIEGLEEALLVAADARPEPRGVVRVTAPSFTGSTRVTRALAAFARRYPGIVVEIDATNVLRDLVLDGFDFGIRFGTVVDADFVARPLWHGQFGLFAARDFVRTELGGKRKLSREVLERVPCIVHRPSSVWKFRAPDGREVEVRPRPAFAVNDPRGAVDAARAGLGIVFAPLEAARPAGELVMLEPAFGDVAPVELFLVYPTRRLMTTRVRLAIDWLVNSDETRAGRERAILAP